MRIPDMTMEPAKPKPLSRAPWAFAAVGVLAAAACMLAADPALAQALEAEAKQGFQRVAGFIGLMRRGALIAALVVLVVVVYSAYFTGRFNTRLLLIVFAGLVVLSVGGMGIEYLIDANQVKDVQDSTGDALTKGGFR